MGSCVPVVDLDGISNEKELLEIVKRTLLAYDTFLLRNYANYDTLRDWVEQLTEIQPEKEVGFDGTFTGVFYDKGFAKEQYICDSGSNWVASARCDNELLARIRSRLKKLSLYFAELCLDAVSLEKKCTIGENDCCTVMTRYYTASGSAVLPNLTFDYLREYELYQPSGLLALFPVASGIQYLRHDSWNTIEDEDCLLIHTGDLLARLSKGAHTSSPIRIVKDSKMVRLEISPSLGYINESGVRQLEVLLDQQISAFPEVAEKFRPAETGRLKLKETVKFLKTLYRITISVLTLHKMNHPSVHFVELDLVLPQISNMAKRKVTEMDLLKITSIWELAYVIRRNAEGVLEVEIKPSLLQKGKEMAVHFNKVIDKWLDGRLQSQDEQSQLDISIERPLHDIANRREDAIRVRSKSSFSHTAISLKGVSKRPAKTEPNTKQLLDRIRTKERKAAELLNARELEWKKYLKVKMKQIFRILVALEPKKPYTLTYLTSLIVDSLLDSSNPIGTKEVETIIDQLQVILSDVMIVLNMNGGLKVYKWNRLHNEELRKRLED
ncbi:HFL191Cp [Eremothecium sinecaudum]|uniref:HFL191Cp n=1 Tax=Eremothecium sinecaudum TaxID=45286 RepID=A0A0X8HUI5_9SACH|nr:HFL191Cp [Eremothecium sinecaudum]AMD21665.1 HFL191Cp [Eremothecium sinecaudum]